MSKKFLLRGEAELQPDGTMRVIGILSPLKVPGQQQGLVLISVSETEVELAWDNLGDSLSWEVHRDEQGGPLVVFEAPSNSFTDITVEAGKVYTYTVYGVSDAGVSDAPSNSVIAAPVAEPDVPAKVELTPGVISARSAAFSWTNPGDATGWRVYRDSGLLDTVAVAEYEDTTVVDGSEYDYTVTPFNGEGDGEESDPLTITVPENSAPLWQIDDTAFTPSVGDSFTFNCSQNCEDPDNDPLTFTLHAGSVPGLSFNNGVLNGTLTTAGDYSATLRANDGIETADLVLSFAVSAGADVTPPTTPQLGTPIVTGSTVTIPLAVPASDESGIERYTISRRVNGTGGFAVRAVLASEGDFPYVESGVADGSYEYRVSARDASLNNNSSAFSDVKSCVVSTVPTNPDTPINFSATLISGDDVSITWSAGPGGAPVTGYDLEFSIEANGGSQNGPWQDFSVSGINSTVTHMNLPTGKTWYRVRALSAGGASAFTVPISVTVGQPSTAATFRIPLGTTNWDGNVNRVPLTGGAARKVGPGDILEFEAGTYRDIVLLRVKGSAQNPVILRPPANGQVIFRRLAPKTGGFVMQLKDCKHYWFNGFTTSASVPVTRDGKRHGFKFMYATNATTGNKDGPTAFIKHKGTSSAGAAPFNNSDNCRYSYFHFDGGWDATPANSLATDAGQICFDTNDHAYHRNDFPGAWQENMIFENFLVEDVGGEPTYFGPNPYDTYKGPYTGGGGGIPLRYIKVRDFYVYNTGGQAMQFKSVLGGEGGGDGPTENSIHDGVIYRSTANLGPATNGTPAIILNSSKADVYNVWIEGCGGGAITVQVSDGTNLNFPPNTPTTFRSRIYNCVIVDNNRLSDQYNGIRVASFTGSNPALPAAYKPEVHIFCNTILRHSGPSIKYENSGGAGGTIKNNIVSESGAISAGPATSAGNLINANASAIFIDPVGSIINSNINLKLSGAQAATSPVLPSASAARKDWPTSVNVPLNDLAAAVRSVATATKGAYEFP